MRNGAIAGYSADAKVLIAPFEAISPEAIFAPVAHLLPTAPACIAEIGAGTGRDAAWLADHGHHVLAVEPVDAFREAGMKLHPSPRIAWLSDVLPGLPCTLARGGRFDLVTLIAVWQHLDADQQREAIPNLAALVTPGGHLILSIRHGPGAPTRPCFPSRPEDVIALGAASGLHLVFRRETESIQAANRANGVTWTWLAFTPG
jgi:SAM-dependent methyltransferase